MTNKILDYAIIGGGVAGVYSGWRLLEDSGQKLNIELFECSKRLGGRLLSLVPPKVPNARVELGGMRFILDAQPWISALVTEGLALATDGLQADMPQNFAYVRGKLLRQFELTDPDEVPYDLADDERAPDAINNLTAFAAMRSLKKTIQELLGIEIAKWTDLTSKLNESDWETIAQNGTYDGATLASLPMRYMMLQSISHEAFRMAEDTSGYDSILYTWNGADGFSWNVGDYGPNVEYRHVHDGYDQVPLQLGDLFCKRGGKISLGTRLESFRTDGDGNVVIVVEEAGARRTVVARNLVLAIPRRSIELLEQTGPVLDPENTEIHDMLAAVTPIPLFKLAICYDEAWFQDPAIVPPVNIPKGKKYQKIHTGKSITDLPIRQCYYWKIAPDEKHCVLLIYDDGRDLDYWAGLRGDSEPFPNTVDREFDLPHWNSFAAPKRMVDEVHRQMLEMHGVQDASLVPKPYAAAYRDWGEDPYGGGANFWHVGSRSYEVGNKIIQPNPEVPVYIVGECWSHAQGWVEGALATAEQMLQGHLEISAPPWKAAYEKKRAAERAGKRDDREPEDSVGRLPTPSTT